MLEREATCLVDVDVAWECLITRAWACTIRARVDSTHTGTWDVGTTADMDRGMVA